MSPAMFAAREGGQSAGRTRMEAAFARRAWPATPVQQQRWSAPAGTATRAARPVSWP